MRGLVRWLLARRFRLIVLAGVLAPVPVIGCISTALMTLETLHRGPQRGLASAVAALIVCFPLAWLWGADPGGFLAVSGTLLGAGTMLGALLRRVGSLSRAYQGVGLICAIGALLAALLWPEPGPWLTGLLDQLANALGSGDATDQQVRARVEELGRFFVGLMVAGVFVQLMAALLLGSWWAAQMQPESQFGPQFRRLRLGRLVGIAATLLMASSLVADGPMVRNLFPLVLCAFWFQGIAVVHAWAWAKRWRAGFLAPMYVLLVPPFTAVTVLLLASVGLVDNWIELRAPLREQIQRRN